MRILSLFLFSVLSSMAVSAQPSTTFDLSRHGCCGGDATNGRESYRKPLIRTIAAFVRIDPIRYRQQIEEAVAVLRQGNAAFEKRGYEVQTIRVTTQPFAQYIGDPPKSEALDFFTSLDEISKKDSFLLNIGSLTLNGSSDKAKLDLLGQILATTRVNASLVIAGDDGVHWN